MLWNLRGSCAAFLKKWKNRSRCRFLARLPPYQGSIRMKGAIRVQVVGGKESNKYSILYNIYHIIVDIFEKNKIDTIYCIQYFKECHYTENVMCLCLSRSQIFDIPPKGENEHSPRPQKPKASLTFTQETLFLVHTHKIQRRLRRRRRFSLSGDMSLCSAWKNLNRMPPGGTSNSPDPPLWRPPLHPDILFVTSSSSWHTCSISPSYSKVAKKYKATNILYVGAVSNSLDPCFLMGTRSNLERS